MTRMQGLGSTGLGSKQPELASEPISESQDSDSDGDAQSAYPSRSDSESQFERFRGLQLLTESLSSCYPGHHPSRCIWDTLAYPYISESPAEPLFGSLSESGPVRPACRGACGPGHGHRSMAEARVRSVVLYGGQGPTRCVFIGISACGNTGSLIVSHFEPSGVPVSAARFLAH